MRNVLSLNAEERLGRIGRRIDHLIEAVQTTEAAEKVRADVARELRRIDHQVAATRAQIAQDLATTRKDLSDAVREELDVWKARLEELRVQTSLGRMEVRERLEPVIERVDLSLERIRKHVDRLTNAEVVDADDLERSVREALRELRREMDAATELQ